MLRPCTKDEFDRYVDFAYALATDPAKSGYPSYCDGIKTRAMFVERSLKAFERETEEMLVFEREGEVQGLIHYYWIPEDRYVQTNGFNINTAAEQALAEFLAYIGERFRGYEAYLGFPAENEAAVDGLVRRGFECIESDWNNTAFPDRLGPIPENEGVIPISRDNYELFRRLHSQAEGDMYWNSDRIWDDLEHWTVLALAGDAAPRGAVYYRDLDDGWFEIFGIDVNQGAFDPGAYRALLNAALRDAKRRAARFVTFFCEDEYERTAVECGFTPVGKYLCYKIHLE